MESDDILFGTVENVLSAVSFGDAAFRREVERPKV
jgi:hypothetical protein